MEEVGEASKEAVDYHFKNGVVVDHNEASEAIKNIQYSRLEKCRQELIQVAAVAVQIVESLDRNELKKEEAPNPGFFAFRNLVGEEFRFFLNDHEELQLTASYRGKITHLFDLSKFESKVLVQYLSSLFPTASGDDNS